MERNEAFAQLRTICQRLDEIDPQNFFITPQHLYLQGGFLSDKPNAKSVNLLLAYTMPTVPEDNLAGLNSEQHLLFQKAVDQLCRDLEQVYIEPHLEGTEPSSEDSPWPDNFRPQLVWAPGLPWEPIVNYLEDNPIAWEGIKAAWFKSLDEKTAQITSEQGNEAALKWVKDQVRAYHDIQVRS